MREFLQRWSGTCSRFGKRKLTALDRFVDSSRVLADMLQQEGGCGSLVTDWADKGILVWLPDGELVVPDEDEWGFFLARLGQR